MTARLTPEYWIPMRVARKRRWWQLWKPKTVERQLFIPVFK